jgi:hypothetical protein
MAKTVLALVTWALYALVLGALARLLALRVVELSLALAVFLVGHQQLVGGEWIFGTVEPKVFAYIMVFAGLTAALAGRRGLMIVAMAAATYFHFLIGGAWTVFLLLLLAMEGARPRDLALLLGAYAGLVLPVLAMLVSERSGAGVDVSALGRTVDQIYAEFRAPSLVAPFLTLGGFATDWAPGIVMHVALACVLVIGAQSAAGRDRTLLLWAAVLNFSILLVLGLAFLDRHTHVFAKFLMFRPSAMVFLMSCLLLVRAHFPSSGQDRTRLSASVLILVAAVAAPQYVAGIGRMLTSNPPETRLLSQMTEDERDVVRWVAANTPSDAVVLLDPLARDMTNEDSAYFQGFERASGRPMIVDYKNVPSDLQDFVSWYERLLARQAFFGGDCTQAAVLGVTHVVFRGADVPEVLRGCATPVHANGTFVVARAAVAP